jgi:hypothetical protein
LFNELRSLSVSAKCDQQVGEVVAAWLLNSRRTRLGGQTNGPARLIAGFNVSAHAHRDHGADKEQLCFSR